MKIFKKFSLTLLSLMVCALSAFIFAGCDDEVEYEKLYVFSSQGGYVQVDDNEEYVQWGDEGKSFTLKEDTTVKLKAVANTGYKFVRWTYAEGLSEKGYDFSNQAEINLVMDEDIIVLRAEFELQANARFDVSYTNGSGYEIVPEAGNNTTVIAGNAFRFRVNVLEGYDANSLVVKVNNSEITAENGVYTISNIIENKTITVSVDKAKYTVTLPTSDAYTIAPVSGYSTTVEYRDEFKFTVEANAGYDATDMVVKNGSTTLVADGGVYTITVTDNTSITVEGVKVEEVATYTVTLPSDVRINVEFVTGGNTIEEGESVSFEITAKNDTIDLSNMIVTCNNGAISVTKVGNVYSVQNVKTNLVFAVSGIDVYSYTVTLPTSDAYTITPVSGYTTTVTHGDEFKFTVEANVGYNANSIVVKVNGTSITAVNNVYTITNIVENKNITVSINKTQHIVTLPTGEGYTIIPVSGYSTTVEYGNQFKFTIAVDEGYDATDMVVKNGTITLSAVGGVYTIIVTGNTSITVAGVEVEEVATYTVTLIQPKRHVTLIYAGESEVEEGSTLEFSVKIDTSVLNANDVAVKANGNVLTSVSSVNSNGYTTKTYKVENIASDINITADAIAIYNMGINYNDVEDLYGVDAEMLFMLVPWVEFKININNELPTQANEDLIVYVYEENSVDEVGTTTIQEMIESINFVLNDMTEGVKVQALQNEFKDFINVTYSEDIIESITLDWSKIPSFNDIELMVYVSQDM